MRAILNFYAALHNILASTVKSSQLEEIMQRNRKRRMQMKRRPDGRDKAAVIGGHC